VTLSVALLIAMIQNRKRHDDRFSPITNHFSSSHPPAPFILQIRRRLFGVDVNRSHHRQNRQYAPPIDSSENIALTVIETFTVSSQLQAICEERKSSRNVGI
jgi:hypothetical protein